MVEQSDLHEARLGLPFCSPQMAIDLFGSFFAVRNGADYEARTESNITRGKNAGRGAHQSLRVYLDGALASGLNPVFGQQEREVGSLTNGQDYRIAINDALGSLRERGVEPMLCI